MHTKLNTSKTTCLNFDSDTSTFSEKLSDKSINFKREGSHLKKTESQKNRSRPRTLQKNSRIKKMVFEYNI